MELLTATPTSPITEGYSDHGAFPTYHGYRFICLTRAGHQHACSGFFQTQTPLCHQQRNLVAQTIERLLDLLDAIDPDPEEEPSLGWPIDWEGFPQVADEQHHLKGYGTGDDREGSGHLGLTDDHEPEERLHQS